MIYYLCAFIYFNAEYMRCESLLTFWKLSVLMRCVRGLKALFVSEEVSDNYFVSVSL